jgi:hypothetical protein
MGDLKGSYAPKHEFILYGHKGRRLRNGFRYADIIKANRTNNKLHPTQKPVDLLEIFINQSTNKNEITKSENDQIQFEEKIIKEINDIWNKYKFNFVTCVIELGNIMVYLNKEELLILKNYF